MDAVEALFSPLAGEDAVLEAARTEDRVSVPGIAINPAMGRFLSTLTLVSGARRVLEFGTLAGYSTIWLARAVGPSGRVVSLELDRGNAAIAREHLEDAGVSAWVDIYCGNAAEVSGRMVEAGMEPFDLVFIDADRPSLPTYLERSMALTRPGSLIVVDNVVRGGAVLDDQDAQGAGIRAMLAAADADERLTIAALQTTGEKGWDGFAVLHRVG